MGNTLSVKHIINSSRTREELVELMKKAKWAEYPEDNFDYKQLYISREAWEEIKNWGEPEGSTEKENT